MRKAESRQPFHLATRRRARPGSTPVATILAVAMLCAGATRASDEGAVAVSIDILPGEARNIVDPSSVAPLPLAILGSAALDVRTIDPFSLRLGHGAIVKNDNGETHVFEDVNADGRLDLVVWFSARDLHLADTESSARLTGATLAGARIEGTDAVRTLAAAIRTASQPILGGEAGVAIPEEKRPPLDVVVRVLPEDAMVTGGDRVAMTVAGSGGAVALSRSVALLASADFDPRDAALETIRIDGHPITKRPDGGVATFSDVDGDGRIDLVVSVDLGSREPAAGSSPATPRTARLSGLTRTGRTLRDAASAPSSSDGGAPPEVTADDVPPAAPPVVSPPPFDVSVSGRYPGSIALPDVGPASVYPAPITISGASGVVSKVRVTLNGLVHSCSGDLDILLVAPSGQSFVVMSDTGWCGFNYGPFNLTFDDFASTILAGVPASGSYKPSNFGLGDGFPAPAPVPSEAAALSVFQGVNPNGVWKLYIVDDAAADTGTLTGGWTLDILTMTRVCNTTPLTIPAGAPGTTSGPASVYPSRITVSGVTGTIAKATISLEGLSHAAMEHLDIGVVTPSGYRVMLASDVGAGGPVSDLQLTFDDDASSYITSTPWSGSWRASWDDPFDAFPPPAPSPFDSGGPLTLGGTSPNGDWDLYIADDTSGGTGVLARGWCVNITTIEPAENCQPLAITIPAGAPGTTGGPAAPYPSVMTVAGATGSVLNAGIKLVGLSHTFPDDLDIVLQSPSGKRFMMMSDVGGSQDVVNLDLAISWATGVGFMPDDGPITFSSYYPTDAGGPGEVLPAPAPGPPYTDDFVDDSPNGDWKLWVYDDKPADVGQIAGGWCLDLDLTNPFVTTCSTGGSMTIPGAPGASSGPAAPYPWPIVVSPQGTIVRKIVVQLHNMHHTFADDLDLLLVGPQGQKALFMSDAGGTADINGDMYFDDESGTPLPDSSLTLPQATYNPRNFNGGDADAFPAPAPAGPYGSALSAFYGTNAEGTWNLYVLDDAGGDTGSISSWCLEVWPLFPAGEATNLRWQGPGKTTLTWDAAPNADGYLVLRGERLNLPDLLTAVTDDCQAAQEHRQINEGLAAIPQPGKMYWYLVVGTSGGQRGPAGNARIGTMTPARIADTSAFCGAP